MAFWDRWLKPEKAQATNASSKENLEPVRTWREHFTLCLTEIQRLDRIGWRKRLDRDSLAALEQALVLAPDRPEPKLVLAAQWALRRYDEAAALYRGAVASAEAIDSTLYPPLDQAKDHWEVAQAAAMRGDLELAQAAFVRALEWNATFRTEMPDVMQARDCWLEVAYSRLPHRDAFSAAEAQWWRMWLRKDRQALYEQGTAAFPFLMERAWEKYTNLPPLLVEIAASWPDSPDFQCEQAAQAAQPPSAAVAAILAAARREGTDAPSWDRTFRRCSWNEKECNSTAHQALVDLATECYGNSFQPLKFIAAIGRTGDPRATDPLLSLLSGTIGPEAMLIRAIGAVADERAVTPLICCLDLQDEPRPCDGAASALEQILERHSATLSDECLTELVNLKHTYRVETVTGRRDDDDYQYNVIYGVNVGPIRNLAQAELNRRTRPV